jgi:hypothetical protein
MTAVNECGNEDDAYECPPAKQHAPRDTRAACIGSAWRRERISEVDECLREIWLNLNRTSRSGGRFFRSLQWREQG